MTPPRLTSSLTNATAGKRHGNGDTSRVAAVDLRIRLSKGESQIG
jgi:hypothetical protein